MGIYRVHKVKAGFMGRTLMNFDPFWTGAEVLSTFVYPWDKEPPPTTIFRSLHNKRYFYFRFDVIDNGIIVERGTADKMAVLNSDRVEIFFRSDEKMQPYYGLEMDPLGRVLDYKADFYRKFDYKWSWKGITVRSAFTLNGYRVWGCIPLNSLRLFNLISGNKLQGGLFRGKCMSVSPGVVSFKWISWMKPHSEQPDFHIPSAFGELMLEGL